MSLIDFIIEKYFLNIFNHRTPFASVNCDIQNAVAQKLFIFLIALTKTYQKISQFIQNPTVFVVLNF